MLIIGLAGTARSGKNTVADYLCKRYGFVQFAFSDALYQEVQDAFGLEDQSLLRGGRKETPLEELSLTRCSDTAFVEVATDQLDQIYSDPKLLAPWAVSLSPRQILQWWGTEYRRAQDSFYWLRKAGQRLDQVRSAWYPEHRPQFFVETGTRFENERDWIRFGGHDCLWDGTIWHIHRNGVDDSGSGHLSAQPLPVLAHERELWNNDTIERLHHGVDLLLSTRAKFVKVEPPLPMDQEA